MKIPIVNEQDEVIGLEERSVIHQKGLKHREIHVWLVTPKKEFIFQERGKNADTWPGFLDVTAGGHVDNMTETYQECAERELFEETGVKLPIKLISKIYSESYDPNTNSKNHAFRATFAGLFSGELEDLKIEEDSGLGFKKFSISDIKNMTEEQRSKVIPRLFSEQYFEIYNMILKTLFS